MPMYSSGIDIGLQSGSTGVALLAFIAGVSAATSMIVVTTLALASMTANNLVLPFFRPRGSDNPYRRLTLTRAVLTAVIIFTGEEMNTARKYATTPPAPIVAAPSATIWLRAAAISASTALKE